MASRAFAVRHGLKSNTPLVIMMPLLLLLPVVQIMRVEVAAKELLDTDSENPCLLSNPAMDPTHEVRYGHDMVWQIPAEPKAVLFLAHGGSMESFQFFDQGPHCVQCYGMPECRTAVLEALRRGYAVISVTGYEIDAQVLSTITSEWMAQHLLDRLPLTAWGYSSGTYLVTALTQTLRIQASVLMCGEGNSEVEAMATRSSFPSTLFVFMPRDVSVPEHNITNKVVKAMATLEAQGVEVSKTPCFPKPLSPLFFTERILCMTEGASKSVYAALKSEGWIGRDGYLEKNPAVEDFESVLVRAKALPFCAATGGLCLINHVSQELLMAYAEHSFTSDANDAVFRWLDSHIASSSAVHETDLRPLLSPSQCKRVEGFENSRFRTARAVAFRSAGLS